MQQQMHLFSTGLQLYWAQKSLTGSLKDAELTAYAGEHEANRARNRQPPILEGVLGKDATLDGCRGIVLPWLDS